jgi:type II secretory pathway component PulF
MPVYAYRACTATAETMAGTLVADSPRQVREQLTDRGWTVHRVTETSARSGRGSFFRRRRYLARSTEFLRDLSTLLSVGVPLVEGIGTLASQQPPGFASVLLKVQDRLSAGVSLATAMREQTSVFDPMDAALAEVGETAGTLDVVLARLAEFKENRAAARGRVGTALIYPAVVFCVAISVSVLLMTFVVPKLLASLIESGRPVPAVTRLVKLGSDLLIEDGWIIGLLLMAAVIAIGWGLSTSRGRQLRDRWILRVPVLGPAVRKQAIARMAVILSTLLHGGIEFVRAVRIARESTDNSVMAAALAGAETAVTSGTDLAAAVAKTGAFPPMVVQMFAVGQQSGRLEEMLDRLAADYERQARALTARLTAILEPALILFMVLLVGIIAFATLLPMLEAADVF